MLIGYMRVSSVDDRQSVDLQRDALLAAGVDERHLYSDKASGARDDRSGLKTCLEYLKEGDTLIVWKLDRLGRSLANLLTIITDLKVRGVAFQSLTEQMDTTALLQRLAAVRGRLSLCADQAAAAKWWLSMPMASVSAEGPMPKALSTRRTSPLMPGCRHQGRACPLRRARMTSNPLIVA